MGRRAVRVAGVKWKCCRSLSRLGRILRAAQSAEDNDVYLLRRMRCVHQQSVLSCRLFTQTMLFEPLWLRGANSGRTVELLRVWANGRESGAG